MHAVVVKSIWFNIDLWSYDLKTILIFIEMKKRVAFMWKEFKWIKWESVGTFDHDQSQFLYTESGK